MDLREEVIQSLQTFIIERENANKNRQQEAVNGKGIDLSLTQFHILDIINREDKVNNKKLVQELKISAPGVSKAIRKLLNLELITQRQIKDNNKERYYDITNRGSVYVGIHDELHEKARSRYLGLLDGYTDEQLETLISFFNKIITSLKNE